MQLNLKQTFIHTFCEQQAPNYDGRHQLPFRYKYHQLGLNWTLSLFLSTDLVAKPCYVRYYWVLAGRQKKLFSKHNWITMEEHWIYQ